MELLGFMGSFSSSPFRRVRGFLAFGAIIAMTVAMGVAAAVAAAWIYFHPQHEWTRGVVYGETDEFSYNVIDRPVHIHEMNATILHCLGIDHRRLSYKFQGLDMRLTGVEDHNPVADILA